MSSLYPTYPHLLAPPHVRHSSHASQTQIRRPPGSTGTGTGTGTPVGMTPHEPTSLGLGAKLRHMLDMQKYAIFDVAITIQELGNVPQLQGEFVAKWKFHGKKPSTKDKGKDGLALISGHRPPSAKPSLPNLKLAQGGLADHPSSSSVSIRSTSTGGSSGHTTPSYSQAMKGKSMSTPPLSMSLNNLVKGKHRSVDKKGSDPTPLRHSVNLESEPEIVESPAASSIRITDDEGNVERDEENQATPNGRLHSHPMGGQQGSTASGSSTMPPSTIGTASSASSSTSYLSIPVPSSNTPRSTMLERTPSQQTMSSSTGSVRVGTRSSLGVKDGERPHIRRIRSSSTTGPAPDSRQSKQSGRHGHTASRPLKSHTCTWHHDIRLPLRLPLSKDKDRAASLGMKTKAPILGDGPESATGLTLTIEEVSTPSTTSITHNKTPGPHHTVGNFHSPAHHARMRNADVGPDTGESEESKHDRAKDMMTKGKHTTFGKVDIDLAAFAGRGLTTRKFLLKGSRTNATVKICVEMTWIGGEEKWAAPPLQEGHHVTGQMKEVMGGRDVSESLQKDLLLMKTPSASSAETSQTNTHSDMSRNTSSNNLAGSAPVPFAKMMHPPYKTYEPQRGTTRTRKPGPTTLPGQRTSTPEERAGGGDETASSSSPQTPTASRSPITFWHNRHHSPRSHHHHFRHLRKDRDEGPKKTRGIAELPPETIIENIFNPHTGHVDGPFTYVPVAVQPEPEIRGEAEHYEQEDVGVVLPEKTRLWRRRGKLRTVSSMTITGISKEGDGPPIPGRGPSLPRTSTGTSTLVHT